MVFARRRRAPVRRRNTKKRAPLRRRVKVSKALTSAITRVISKKAESKVAMLYGSTQSFPQDGLFANRGFSVQNQFISSTTSDMKLLLPYVAQGTNENERIGEQVSPTSLRIDGLVKVSLTNLTTPAPTDIFVVLYVLTHKVYKSYEGLLGSPAIPPATGFVGGNNFNQLLKNGENATTNFTGNWWAAHQPVADQYYNVLAKKIIRLRFAGLYTSGGQSVSIANSHDYQANWSLTLTQKQLPAHLKYPETTSTGAFINQPLNYAPFLCMGYYNADGNNTSTPQAVVEQTYTTRLAYKDM